MWPTISRMALGRFLEKAVLKAEVQSLHVCTTWWTKIRLSQNSLISQKDGTRREQHQDSRGNGLSRGPSTPTNNCPTEQVTSSSDGLPEKSSSRELQDSFVV